ncbi:hypothetical protein CHS0354_015912 [Potamilus streckersoni]|uniref:ATP synthase F0 subunit 8 n=1 Tax=Potamilus streckersoni TaxID=2493646 RepID=A0AAE0SDH7_9BIVA|nr:hypothetical protein CHS0354_015912 [Potamilus streckersoni]
MLLMSLLEMLTIFQLSVSMLASIKRLIDFTFKAISDRTWYCSPSFFLMASTILNSRMNKLISLLYKEALTAFWILFISEYILGRTYLPCFNCISICSNSFKSLSSFKNSESTIP